METFLGLFLIFLGCVSAKFQSNESLLAAKLLDGYNAQMRPYELDNGNKTTVTVGMTLTQIISIKEKSQELTTSVYMYIVWKDDRFGWKPKDYNNIQIARLPPASIWTPRIVLQNSKGGSFDVSLMTNVLIKSDGNLEWLPPALYKSSCTIEVALFPFDWQNCTMTFGSATYDRSQMTLECFGETWVDCNAFQANGEWDLLQKPARVITSPGDPLYQDVTFYFIIRRRPQFYVMNLIIPCILMSSLSCFVFYLPSISCEKMTLSISILLGETVFLFLIAQRMPETSLAIPLIAKYLLFCMTLVIVSVITSVLVCNVHYRSNTTHFMPDWICWLFMGKLAPLLKVERPKPEEDEDQNGIATVRRSSSFSRSRALRERCKAPSEVMFNNQACRFGFRQRHKENKFGFTEFSLDEREGTNLIPPALKMIPRRLKPAAEAISYIAHHKKLEDAKSQSQDDWAYVAYILDRLFLWVYCAVFIIGTLGLFLQTASADYPEAMEGTQC